LPWASSPTAASTCDVVPVALPVRTSGRRRWRWRCSVDAVTLALCRAEEVAASRSRVSQRCAELDFSRATRQRRTPHTKRMHALIATPAKRYVTKHFFTRLVDTYTVSTDVPGRATAGAGSCVPLPNYRVWRARWRFYHTLHVRNLHAARSQWNI
jgi:hypothetical protein